MACLGTLTPRLENLGRKGRSKMVRKWVSGRSLMMKEIKDTLKLQRKESELSAEMGLTARMWGREPAQDMEELLNGFMKTSTLKLVGQVNTHKQSTKELNN